jgi:hypothetical protein
VNEARPRRRRLGEALLFAALLAAHLAPLVALPRLPTQDGPSHQALAYALAVWDEPEGALLRQWFVRTEGLRPNACLFHVQAALIGIVDAATAEKILLGGYVVLLPLALLYAVRSVDGDSGFLAVLGFPFVYNFLTNLGFFNFGYGLAGYLLALGVLLRQRRAAGWRRAWRIAVLGLLSLAVYLSHPVPLVVLVVSVITLGGWWAWRAARRHAGETPTLAAAAREHLLPPLLAVAPALALFVGFFDGRLDRPTRWEPFLASARQLFTLETLASLDRRTVWVAGALAAFLLWLVLDELRRRVDEAARRPGVARPAEGLLLLALVTAAMVFVSPDDVAGGGFLVDRLTLFPPLVLVLWLAGGRWGLGLRWAVQGIAAGLAVTMLTLLWGSWVEVDRTLDDYRAAAERIEAGHVALPVAFAHQVADDSGAAVPYRVYPFVHALGYTAATRPIVHLGLYEGTSDLFPLRFRSELDPYLHLADPPGALNWAPPAVDLPGYEGRTGRRVDYVLVWLPDGAPAHAAAQVRDLYRQLEEGYERDYVSPRGLAELWRRR